VSLQSGSVWPVLAVRPCPCSPAMSLQFGYVLAVRLCPCSPAHPARPAMSENCPYYYDGNQATVRRLTPAKRQGQDTGQETRGRPAVCPASGILGISFFNIPNCRTVRQAKNFADTSGRLAVPVSGLSLIISGNNKILSRPAIAGRPVI
jgi:hypothetical protein